MAQLSVRSESWPFAGTFTISRGSRTTSEVVVAELKRDGFCGRGECVPYPRYGESVSQVMEQIQNLTAAVADGLQREDLQKALQPGAARNALDCAFWDLQAKRSGRSVWQLAGLDAPRPPTRSVSTRRRKWARPRAATPTGHCSKSNWPARAMWNGWRPSAPTRPTPL